MSEGYKPKKPLLWPTIWLVAGLLLGLTAAFIALADLGLAAGVLGALTAAVAIVLTYVIAYRQAIESSELSGTVAKIDVAVSDLAEANERLYQLTLSAAEKDSAQAYEGDEELASDAPVVGVDRESLVESDDNEPPYASEALARLRSAGSMLTDANASWKQKIPNPPLRGNHGWFVESNDSAITERWYVRKGRYWNIRKAMPREFLDALESQRGVDPRTIKLDFQLKKHGLASWYARTYDGSLWRVWRPNRNADLGVQIEPVPDDLQAS